MVKEGNIIETPFGKAIVIQIRRDKEYLVAPLSKLAVYYGDAKIINNMTQQTTLQ